MFVNRVAESVKALEVCQSAAPFDTYDVNQNVMPLVPMSPTLLAATANGGTAVSLAFNNHAVIGQVQFILFAFVMVLLNGIALMLLWLLYDGPG